MPGGTGNQPTLNHLLGGLVQYGNPGGNPIHLKEVVDYGGGGGCWSTRC